jgi:hypothetical protein
MSRADIERRLDDLSRRLRKARDELASIDAELAVVGDEAGDASVRALMSEHREDERTAYEAGKHADALRRSRAKAVDAIEHIRREQNELIERLPIR